MSGLENFDDHAEDYYQHRSDSALQGMQNIARYGWGAIYDLYIAFVHYEDRERTKSEELLKIAENNLAQTFGKRAGAANTVKHFSPKASVYFQSFDDCAEGFYKSERSDALCRNKMMILFGDNKYQVIYELYVVVVHGGSKDDVLNTLKVAHRKYPTLDEETFAQMLRELSPRVVSACASRRSELGDVATYILGY